MYKNIKPKIIPETVKTVDSKISKKDIGILKTLGFTNLGILKVFFIIQWDRYLN